MARRKSDHVDAMTLVNIPRTDAHAHRTPPADSDLARAIMVLARAAQGAIWRRVKATQELRALLREYYPGFLEAFAGNGHTDLAMADARAILVIAPTPAQGARLTKGRIGTALRRGRSATSARRHRDSNPGCAPPPAAAATAAGGEGSGPSVERLAGNSKYRVMNAEDLKDAAPMHSDSTPSTESSPAFRTWVRRPAPILAEIGNDCGRFAGARADSGVRRHPATWPGQGPRPVPSARRPARRRRYAVSSTDCWASSVTAFKPANLRRIEGISPLSSRYGTGSCLTLYVDRRSISGSSTPPGSATPRIIRETGAGRHIELGDRGPEVRDYEEGSGANCRFLGCEVDPLVSIRRRGPHQVRRYTLAGRISRSSGITANPRISIIASGCQSPDVPIPAIVGAIGPASSPQTAPISSPWA